MNVITKICAVVLMGTMVVGCTNEAGEVNKQALVGLTGAVGGGILGAQVGKGKGNTAAIIGGTLIGGLLGSEIGKSLDKNDVVYHRNAQAKALESNRSGVASTWKNPDTGASGTTTPKRTFTANDGRYCREYQQTITVGGRVQKGYGTACRSEDGSWEIVSTN